MSARSTLRFSMMEEMEALSALSQKARWDPEELNMMAAFEARNQGAKNINMLIWEKILHTGLWKVSKGPEDLLPTKPRS